MGKRGGERKRTKERNLGRRERRETKEMMHGVNEGMFRREGGRGGGDGGWVWAAKGVVEENRAPERGQAAAGRAELGRPAAWVRGVGWRTTAAVGNEGEKKKKYGKKKGKKASSTVPGGWSPRASVS